MPVYNSFVNLEGKIMFSLRICVLMYNFYNFLWKYVSAGLEKKEHERTLKTNFTGVVLYKKFYRAVQFYFKLSILRI